MAGVTEEVSFYFYLILIDFHLNSHMWQLATMMDSANLDPSILCPDSPLASGRNHQPHWDLRPGEEGGREGGCVLGSLTGVTHVAFLIISSLLAVD